MNTILVRAPGAKLCGEVMVRRSRYLCCYREWREEGREERRGCDTRRIRGTNYINQTHHTLTEMLAFEVITLKPLDALQEELKARVSVRVAVGKLGGLLQILKNPVPSVYIFYLICIFFFVKGKGK